MQLQVANHFLDSISSEFTKKEYSNHLKRFSRFASENTTITAIEQDPKLLTDHIIKYLVRMKNDDCTLSATSIISYKALLRNSNRLYIKLEKDSQILGRADKGERH